MRQWVVPAGPVPVSIEAVASYIYIFTGSTRS